MFSVVFVCVCVCLFVCLCVCWLVCPDDNSKSVIAIAMRFSVVHIKVPELIPFDFGDDPDIRPDIRFNNFLNI